MSVDVLVLQHIACEPPGVYEDVLRERGATLRRVEVDAGDELPDWREFDAIVAMGGPMSANDDDALPWLREEKELVAEAVRAGMPFWGVCLGVQLLAALGNREVDLQERVRIAVEHRRHAVLLEQLDVLEPVDVLSRRRGQEIDVLDQRHVFLVREAAAGKGLGVDRPRAHSTSSVGCSGR